MEHLWWFYQTPDKMEFKVKVTIPDVVKTDMDIFNGSVVSSLS